MNRLYCESVEIAYVIAAVITRAQLVHARHPLIGRLIVLHSRIEVNYGLPRDSVRKLMIMAAPIWMIHGGRH